MVTSAPTIMRLRESTNRISRVLLLAFMLTAVWPFGNYDPRLELSYPTEIPAALRHTTPPDGAEGWLSFLSPARAFAARVTAAKYQQPSRPQAPHVAALSFARDSLGTAESDPLPRAEYEPFLCPSFAVQRPAERGPPCPG